MANIAKLRTEVITNSDLLIRNKNKTNRVANTDHADVNNDLLKSASDSKILITSDTTLTSLGGVNDQTNFLGKTVQLNNGAELTLPGGLGDDFRFRVFAQGVPASIVVPGPTTIPIDENRGVYDVIHLGSNNYKIVSGSNATTESSKALINGFTVATDASNDVDLYSISNADIDITLGSPNENRRHNIGTFGNGKVKITGTIVNTSKSVIPAEVYEGVDFRYISGFGWVVKDDTEMEFAEVDPGFSTEAILQSITLNADQTDVVTFNYSAPVTLTNLDGFFINGPYHFTQIVTGTNTTSLQLRLNDNIVPGTVFRPVYVRQYGNLVDDNGKRVMSIGLSDTWKFTGQLPDGLENITTYFGNGVRRYVDPDIAENTTDPDEKYYDNLDTAINAAQAGDWVLMTRGKNISTAGIIKSGKSGTATNYLTICGYGDEVDGRPVLNISANEGIRFNNSSFVHWSDFTVNAASGQRAFNQHGNGTKNYTTNMVFQANGSPSTLVSIDPDLVPGTPSLDTNFLFNELIGPTNAQMMKVVWGARVTDGFYVSFNKFSGAATGDLLRFLHENNTSDPGRTFNNAIASWNEFTNWEDDAFDCFGGNDIIVEYNWCHDGAGGGLKCGGQNGTGGGADTPPGSNVICRYNFVADCGRVGCFTNRNNDASFYGNLVLRCDIGIRIDNGTVGTNYVDNNTILYCRIALGLYNTSGTVKARNNILHATYRAIEANGNTKQLSNNVFLGGGVSGPVTNVAPITSSLAAVFVDPANGDYTLRSDSPALNAGVAITEYTYDYGANGNPIEGSVDCGCYEYNTPANVTTIPSITMYGATDSIGHNESSGKLGWFQSFGQVTTSKATTISKGNEGESALSYYELDLAGDRDWPSLIASVQENDIVFINFGHNDKAGAAAQAETVGTGPNYTDGTYYQSLANMFDDLDAKGAKVVFVTPMLRNRYSGDTISTFTGTAGNLLPETDSEQHGERPAAMRKVAADKGATLLDLSAASYAAFNQLSAAELDDTYGDGTRSDKTHLGPTGALLVSFMIRDLINGSNDATLKQYMNNIAPPANSDETMYDFEALTLGSGLPAGWSDAWDPGTYSVIDNGDGSKSIQIDGTDNTRVAMLRDDSQGFQNGDLLVRLRFDAPISGGISFRASGDGSTETAYVARIDDAGVLSVARYINGVYSAIKSVNKAVSGSTWYYMRANISGDLIKVKMWASGVSEPATWDIADAISDVIPNPGKVGVMRFENTVDVDYFAYTTDPTKMVAVPV